MRKPFIGAVVVIHSKGDRPAPALVTAVCADGTSINAHVLPDLAPTYVLGGVLRHGRTERERYWRWPGELDAPEYVPGSIVWIEDPMGLPVAVPELPHLPDDGRNTA